MNALEINRLSILDVVILIEISLTKVRVVKLINSK